MIARLRKLLSVLGDMFWLLPAGMVVSGICLAMGLLAIDRGGNLPAWLLHSHWVYDGGATGARSLLSAVASSTITVAGTVFSITIAALSLAAGQMGPRLLRNFTRDRGNQLTLGAFLGTFAYALMVVRSVRTADEGEFVPHLSLTVGILLAFACVFALVFFVGHMASRINVDTVIQIVSNDVRGAIQRLAFKEPQPSPPSVASWRDAVPVTDSRRGYLLYLHAEGLADWAHAKGVMLRLLVRPGNYVFPGAPIALVCPEVDGVELAIRNATAVGSTRGSSADLEFPFRQLVEVAVRALSPGINDPHTAMAVLNRLGEALCEMAPLHLDSGVVLRDNRPVLVSPAVTYDGMTDGMFHMIRQNAGGNPAVLIRLLEVLTVVASCERKPERVSALRRHADLTLTDAERSLLNPADLDDLRKRHAGFEAVRIDGGAACLAGLQH